jgi:large subunit ribosomal protein L9
MKVILVQDVARLALNFLIPRKLAIPATPENLKKHEATMNKKAEQKAETEESFKDTLATLNEKTITHKISANEQGHLFSGVGVDTIREILASEGHAIEAGAIVLEHPIKELGSFTIQIEQDKLKGEFTLELVSDK